jgi:hypothetical protein
VTHSVSEVVKGVCACVCVCMCVCLYVCMYMYACMYVCMYACACMHVHVCMCKYTLMHVYVCMYMYVCVCVCVCVSPSLPPMFAECNRLAAAMELAARHVHSNAAYIDELFQATTEAATGGSMDENEPDVSPLFRLKVHLIMISSIIQVRLRVCMCVCMFVCMYVCLYIFLYAYMYVCMCVYVCMYVCLCNPVVGSIDHTQDEFVFAEALFPVTLRVVA